MLRRRLQLAVIVGTSLVLATLVGGTLMVLERTRATAWTTAESAVQRTARLVENVVNRQLLHIDGALASVPTLIASAQSADRTITPDMASRLLQGLNYQSFSFRDLLLVRSDGSVWASARSRPRNRPLNVALTGPSDAAPGSSAVHGPVRNPLTGEWVIYVARPLMIEAMGSLYTVAEVPLAFLTTTIANLAEAPGQRIVIQRPDGRILASLPHDENKLVRPPGSEPSQSSGEGTVTHNGASRVVVDRPTLYRDVVVATSLDGSAILAGWSRDRERTVLFVSITGALALAMAIVLILALRHSEKLEAQRLRAQMRLEDAIEAMSDGFVMWDENDRLVTCNQIYRDLYAHTAEYIVPGAHFEDLMRKGALNGQYPQAGNDIEAFVANVVAWHRAARGTIERLLPDGRWLMVTERKTAHGGTVGIRTDITELKKAQTEIAAANERVRETMDELQTQNEALRTRDMALRLQNMLFDAALNNMSHGLLMVDHDHRVIVNNRRFVDLFGLPSEQRREGVRIDEVFGAIRRCSRWPVETIDEIGSRQHAIAAGHGSGTYVARCADGRALAVTQRPLVGGGFVAIYEDVTEQQRAESRIRFLAHHDALTQLPNRVLFRSHLEKLLKELRNTDQQLAVLYLDLDKFKDVNDTLGHPTGDALLEAVGQRLRRCLREGDMVARFGGDEFAICLVAHDATATAHALGERIIRDVSAPYELAGRQVVIGVSIGAAISPASTGETDTLLKSADMALYAAKADGRGGYREFEPDMADRLHARIEIEADLRCAVENQHLELAYQPLVCIQDGRTVGYEALLRWNHPTRGLISPVDFIPLAEETGIIGPIGLWCLEKACADIAALPGAGKVAVNLSPVQLHSDEVVTGVAAALARSGLHPSRLEVEITESVLLEDDEQIVSRLHRLRDMGVGVVLDDFGIGYSSLNYLRRFPFNKIKIDRVFVSEATTRPDCLAIVRSVVDLAGRLGMATTAEGIETAEHLALVREIGCTEGQGYLFGRPQSILHAVAAQASAQQSVPSSPKALAV
ncbi:MAG: bifunctional diguanylate cyclase/phosphodiesterase [Hyphomicrobiaceae bacterium]